MTLGLEGIAATTRFETPEEIIKWLTKERDWLAGLQTVAENQPSSERFAKAHFSNLLKPVNAAITQTNIAIQSDGDQSQISSSVVGYALRINEGKQIYSDSLVGHIVSNLSKADPVQALRVAMTSCSLGLDGGSFLQGASIVAWMRAAAMSELATNGFLNKGPDLDGMMETFAIKWDASFSEVLTRQRETADGQSQILQKFLEQSRHSEEALEAFGDASQKSFADGEARIEAVRQTFKSELTLRAPTTYWTDKKDAHWVACKWWAVAFALGVGLFATAAWFIWSDTTAPYLHVPINAGGQLPQPSFGVFMPTIAVAFLSVWVLRIISRQLLSNFSLGSDAAERVAMVQTFLSLMQEPDHVKENDRILILASLFRPSSDSGDDATPPNWFDLLMQRLNPSPNR